MKWALYNLTTTTHSGGVETAVWWLGRELANQGQAVTIFGGQSDRPLPPQAEKLEVLTFPFRPREQFPDLGSRARKLMERLSFAKTAAPVLRQGRFDRILAFKPYDLFTILRASRAGRTKTGYFSGGTEFYPGFAYLARRLDYLAAVSAFNAAQVEKAAGIPVRVNHTGVDLDTFRPASPDLELAARMGIDPQGQVLVSAVRLVPLKGLQHVLEAMALIRDRWPDLKLLVAGEGPYKDGLAQRARDLGLEGRLLLAGFRQPVSLASFYALGQIGVFPSQGEEALGLSIAEAMACGLPVVASRLGGIPEVLGKGGGVMVPPKDPPALAKALDELLADPQKRKALATKGGERVRQRFTWPACAQRLIEGFEEGG